MDYILPQYYKFDGFEKQITRKTLINTDIPVIKQLFEDGFSKKSNIGDSFGNVSFIKGVPFSIKNKIEKYFDIVYIDNQEGYVIDSNADISVYSDSDRGLLYGAYSLMKLAVARQVGHGMAYECPVVPVRGLKLYLPSSEFMNYFKKFVDMMCYYKYNTIVLEVGGAMEYNRHPEINEGWIEYCKEFKEYSGKTLDVQEGFNWYKDSIHIENGEGSYLTQDETRELVRYCKDRMLEVIPEVPSLSHSDYLLIKHPKLRERVEDPYPDTYCPSNPDSYKLLFDVLDEVIGVFKPTTVHIGHDENYSIGLCEKCSTQKAEQLFSGDIVKIHHYLKERGIKTMMWCDELINSIDSAGKGHGGAEIEMVNEKTGEYEGTIPATYKAIDLIPKDIVMVNWYWPVDGKYDEDFINRGMQLIYGNFKGPEFIDWKKCITRGARGGIISNWSSTKEINLQRNNVMVYMAYSSYLFWNNDYDDSQYEIVLNTAFRDLYHYKYRNITGLSDSGILGGGTNYVEVVHTTDYRKNYKRFHIGVLLEDREYHLGDYILEYDNGSEQTVPVIYGENISNMDVSWERSRITDDPFRASIYNSDRLLMEAAYTTLPQKLDGVTYYRLIIENPYPGKFISGICFRKNKNIDCNIHIKNIEIH